MIKARDSGVAITGRPVLGSMLNSPPFLSLRLPALADQYVVAAQVVERLDLSRGQHDRGIGEPGRERLLGCGPVRRPLHRRNDDVEHVRHRSAPARHWPRWRNPGPRRAPRKRRVGRGARGAAKPGRACRPLPGNPRSRGQTSASAMPQMTNRNGCSIDKIAHGLGGRRTNAPRRRSRPRWRKTPSGADGTQGR